MNPFRSEVVGVDVQVPLRDGSSKTYVNFDNAASTPALKQVLRKVDEFMPWYSSVHRGTGYKSRLATRWYDDAHRKAGEFVGYDPDSHVVVLGKNATEAINKLSYRLAIPDDAVIIVSAMEHHSNDLPWRDKGHLLFAPAKVSDGSLDLDVLRKMIEETKGRLFLVSIAGASNVTGNVNRLPEIAEMVHAAGAHFMVDGAQLVPHRPVRMGKPGEPDSIDFVAFSAHKMYAPFGTGVLVARRDLLRQATGPEYRGGGTVKIVTQDQVFWADDPDVDEAGSPNVVGAIALAEAVSFFQEHGFEEIERIENGLACKLLRELNRMSAIEVYGRSDPDNFVDRLAVLPFNVRGLPHALVAAILGYEHGIGVRSGCFCAHPYIKFLLHVAGNDETALIQSVLHDDRSHIPGAVRISFGLYNEGEEVDRLVEALHRIIAGDYRKDYVVDSHSGEYAPAGWVDDFSHVLSV
ncbi:MAG TPA: aminotransferase class V-fold PLP-dependent enzyme [Fimbriimonadaceae bacterium]|nr:aminotransferase class V-fold PLP-dependent enzyme [Fimbriimonadaceae bacterium]